MKKTAFEIVMEDRKKLVEKIIKNMENGDLIFKKGWNAAILRPNNPVSNLNYLGGNKLRLMDAAIENGYKDPRWVTFKQAAEKGWSIKKGAHGVLCEKWIFTKKIKEIDPETKKVIEKEEKLDRPQVNYFIVFNGEQVQGIPPFSLFIPGKGQTLEIAQDFIETSECKIIEAAQDKAYYVPSKDEIILPIRNSFKSEESFLSTALHEMIHSTGHGERLNRDQTGNFGSSSYAKEELVAELGAIFTQAKLNIKLEGEHFNDHTSYLKSWIKILKSDPNELFRVATQAEKAAERLYSNYLTLEKAQIKEFNLEKPKYTNFFPGLKIDFEFSEAELGIKENTVLRGVKAYNFLEKIIEFDNKQHERQIYLDNEWEKGNKIMEMSYYKTYFTIEYGDYTSRMRIDLGDKEFNGIEKVSEALEYRLKTWPAELIERKKEFAELEKTTPEKIVELAKDIMGRIDRMIGVMKKREAVYLENQYSKKQEKNIILDPWLKKVERDKNVNLSLGK